VSSRTSTEYLLCAKFSASIDASIYIYVHTTASGLSLIVQTKLHAQSMMQSVTVRLTKTNSAYPHCSDLTLAVYSMICFTLSLLLCAAQQLHKRLTACQTIESEFSDYCMSTTLTVSLQLQLQCTCTHSTTQ
jgi:hypothetical protein